MLDAALVAAAAASAATVGGAVIVSQLCWRTCNNTLATDIATGYGERLPTWQKSILIV